MPTTFVDANIAISHAKLKGVDFNNDLNATHIRQGVWAELQPGPLYLSPTAAAEAPQSLLTGKYLIKGPRTDTTVHDLAVKTELLIHRVGGPKDQRILSEVILAVKRGGSVAFATGDKTVINSLFRVAGGDPAKVGNDGVTMAFDVQIEGRTLRVIPVR